ncbi:class I SAM-dependent methyltransferase [Rhizobium mesoamericanum]|uniref:class I SAM-dependent methyltransferase n=1 Tax=Rhizobium mesoamericanum TaxID=1079800 RepID=UPI00048B54B9|nr:class I SAM-dependent methyltransferase [Rhizobium mesoamericanum]
MSTLDRQTHWQGVYTGKNETEVSWHEDSPELSLELLRQAGLKPEMAVIDVGGGASRLVDALLRAGQAHVCVLDLSSAALETAKSRLDDATSVQWAVSDVTNWIPDREYDVWHDRAAFHFLTTAADQQAYVHVLGRSLKNGGQAIIGTFAVDGPEKCSGLPVARYDAERLQTVLGKQFTLTATRLRRPTWCGNYPMLPKQTALIARSLDGLQKPLALDLALTQATSVGTPAMRSLAAEFLSQGSWNPEPGQLVFAGNGRQSIAPAIAAIVPTGGRCGVVNSACLICRTCHEQRRRPDTRLIALPCG